MATTTLIRDNFETGTLNGAINASTTTVTFAAAPFSRYSPP